MKFFMLQGWNTCMLPIEKTPLGFKNIQLPIKALRGMWLRLNTTTNIWLSDEVPTARLYHYKHVSVNPPLNEVHLSWEWSSSFTVQHGLLDRRRKKKTFTIPAPGRVQLERNWMKSVSFISGRNARYRFVWDKAIQSKRATHFRMGGLNSVQPENACWVASIYSG